ncbi:MAG: rhodanese-like domain-containing protein [Akkermansiaceae bacterium]
MNNRSIIYCEELKDLLSGTGGECVLVDVREPVEHAEMHIEGAKLIPLGQLESRRGEIKDDSTIVVMCRGGKRGMEALNKLEAMGFGDVRNLEGGIMAWNSAGYAVNQGEKKVFPLMQQVQITIGVGVLLGVILSMTVHPSFIYLSAFFGAGLLFAEISGWCGLAILLSKMPWNRVDGASCGSGKSCSLQN